MTSKERYREICKRESSIPVFSLPWWLDTVCGDDRWDVLLSLSGDEVAASMPYYLPTGGIISMPPFTQTMGVWFNPAFREKLQSSEIYRRQTICNEFIGQLPRFRYFHQQFHYEFTDWLPFYWSGFRQTTRYTFVLPDISNPEVLRSQLGRGILSDLRKAEKEFGIEIREKISIPDFIDVFASVFRRKGERFNSADVLQRLVETALQRGDGSLWGAYDRENRLHAAVFVVTAGDCAWYVAGGSDPVLRKSGAHPFLLWNVICSLSGKVRKFDFEGSMIRGVADSFRRFGTEQKAYFSIEKGRMKVWDKVMMKLKL